MDYRSCCYCGRMHNRESCPGCGAPRLNCDSIHKREHINTISSQISDAAGNPIGGALASLWTPTGLQVAEQYTDKHGRFCFYALPGMYRLKISGLRGETPSEYDIVIDRPSRITDI